METKQSSSINTAYNMIWILSKYDSWSQTKARNKGMANKVRNHKIGNTGEHNREGHRQTIVGLKAERQQSKDIHLTMSSVQTQILTAAVPYN